MSLDSEAALLVRDAVAVLLAIAAATKAADWSNSTAALTQFLPLRRARQALPILITLELVLALLLFVGAWPTVVLSMAAGVFAGFALAVAWRLPRAAPGETCGCFGLGLPSRPSAFAVGRNVVLTAVCALAASDVPAGVTGSLSLNEFLWLLPASVSLPIVVVSAGALETISGKRAAEEVLY